MREPAPKTIIQTIKTIGMLIGGLVLVFSVARGTLDWLDKRQEERFFTLTRGIAVESKLEEQSKSIGKLEEKLDAVSLQNTAILVEIGKLGTKLDGLNQKP